MKDWFATAVTRSTLVLGVSIVLLGAIGAVDAPSGKSASVPVLACNSSQQGAVPTNAAATFRAGSLALFTFVDPRRVPARVFAHKPGHEQLFRPFKVLVVVAPGAKVTLSVPPDERRRLSLVYQPNLGVRGWHPISAGQTAVTFKACSDQREATVFGGGFLIAGAQCARLRVRAISSSASRDLAIPFAVRRCPPQQAR